MELQIFENSEFGSVRTLLDEDGKILFCGMDVARALGYQNPSRDVNRHCKKAAERCTTDSVGRRQRMLFIPEPDVYRLIFRSRLPAAERFETWVVDEVLPAIRRHGAYITPEVLEQLEEKPEFTSQLVQMLQRENRNLRERAAKTTVKSDYFDALVDTETLTSIRQTAKELHIPEKLFTYLLVEMGFAYRTKRMLMPYAFMVQCGYVELKEYVRGKHGGVYMLFTPVGRLYLMRKIAQRLAVKNVEMQNETNHNG